MEIKETVFYAYPDQALRDFWVNWSENLLGICQPPGSDFQAVVQSTNSNDRSRALDLYNIGVLRGILVNPQGFSRSHIPLGWSLLQDDEPVHTTLGFLSYLIGKTYSTDNELINESFSALCAVFILQLGIKLDDGIQFSYAALFQFLKPYFPQPAGVAEVRWLRYLAAGMFSTIKSYGAESLIDAFLTNQPVDRLIFRWDDSEEEADYDWFCRYIIERKSLTNIRPAKHSLFWLGDESDMRGIYSQATRSFRNFIDHFTIKETHQLQKGLHGKECFNYPFLHKDPLVETPDVIQELQKLADTSPDWQRVITLPMKSLQTGCIEAVSMLYGQDAFSLIPFSTSASEPAQPLPNLPPNRILYGSPGSGKSYRIDETYANGHAQIRVTLHPDSDYNAFVGSYKPVSDAEGNIRYNFVPQAFTNAYLSAWSQPERAVFLIVEEINRGNCAQIFGDLFQCLDRNGSGYSVYPVDADTDLANYLRKAFGESPVAAEQFEQEAGNYKNVGPADYHKLILPRNLFIYATMNTSDQSLFPMDSAFKRRWDWEYVPIDYKDANTFTIVFSDELRYSWGDFIRVVNSRIFSLNESEDKQLGNRFVNPADKLISLAVFKSKVMFYLWSEIYKNETDSSENIFVSKPDPTKSDTKAFTFSELYETDEHGTGRDLGLLIGFMETLGVMFQPIPLTE